MVYRLTVEERLEKLEADIAGLNDALIRVNKLQEEILANDKKLFEIHEHNDEFLKTVEQHYHEIMDRINGQ